MKPSVLIELDRPRNLRLDTNALVKLEEILGRPISALDDNVGMTEMRAILYAGLIHEDKSLTLETVGDLMDGKWEYVSQKTEESIRIAMGNKASGEVADPN